MRERSKFLPAATAKITAVALCLFACPFSRAARAQIVIEGVADKTVYDDTASFRVPAAAGFETTVLLNGEVYPTDQQVTVVQADYYELEVARLNTTSGAEETRLIQFIIRSTARGNSEWGLSPWVPYPPIPSAAAEFEGAHLELIAPKEFPAGIEIPVVAFVEDAGGMRVGVCGAIQAAGFAESPLRLLRGVGSVFLPAAAAGAAISYLGEIKGLIQAKTIQIDGATAWTAASGTLGNATWAENSRIDVTGDITVSAGATLTVGAGAIVRLAQGVEINVGGRLVVLGTLDRPVVFTAANRNAPWGGIVLRTSASAVEMEGVILTGSGADPDWFDNNPGSGSSHRDEQPCIYVQGGARATLTDCYLLGRGRGQGGHGEGSFLTMTRCLVQQFISAGQYNGGSVTLNQSALVEFPSADAPFADADNDALYLTGGSHSLTGCLIGWALDDGTDAGSGSAGPVQVTGCWYESTYHEGMAWSEDRIPTVRDTVAINCGQGIECGFGSPDVDADHILSTGNLSGARFGDNYDWDYEGSLKVTNSLLLFNKRDIWGRAWDDWSEHVDQMDLQTNYVSTAHPSFTKNTLWDPAAHAALLEPFLPTPATVVGIGIALRGERFDIDRLSEGVPVRLSTFTTREVSVDYAVDYAVDTDVVPGETGTLRFVPGETVKRIFPAAPEIATLGLVRVTLTNPVNGELTGIESVRYTRVVPVVIFPRGSEWKYHDKGQDLETDWREKDFDDTSWASGNAKLGFGDPDVITPVDIGPDGARYWTVYFRKSFDVTDPGIYESLRIDVRRDDGAAVYVNGRDVFRTNLPEAGDIIYSTPADSSSTSETTFFSKTVPADMLVPGKNVVAVEVHQANQGSGDLGFDLELIGNKPFSTPAPRFSRADGNGDGFHDLSDAVTMLFALFGGLQTDCADALDADDDGDLAVTDAIRLLEHLFRGGPDLPAPFPGVGEDPTGDSLSCARG